MYQPGTHVIATQLPTIMGRSLISLITNPEPPRQHRQDGTGSSVFAPEDMVRFPESHLSIYFDRIFYSMFSINSLLEPDPPSMTPRPIGDKPFGSAACQPSDSRVNMVRELKRGISIKKPPLRTNLRNWKMSVIGHSLLIFFYINSSVFGLA